jgi:heme/copper-type cytochrome/quinol oxidase subunit 1
MFPDIFSDDTMPTLTRWFIKTALFCFITALAIGAAMQSRRLVTALPALSVIWPAYIHLLMVGWITGLIFGVAYWLFPRSDRLRPALSQRLGWAAYWLLNSGLLLRVATEPVTALDPASPVRWLVPLSALLQLGAACAFAALIWPRVRAR